MKTMVHFPEAFLLRAVEHVVTCVLAPGGGWIWMLRS